MLNLDISLIFIALLVWFLMIVLNKLYFKPVGRIMAQRESKIHGESGQIESMTREIEEKTQHIEQTLKDAKKESTRIREELIKKGETIREQIITDARATSRKHFDTKMKELDKEIAGAGKKLGKQIGVFSRKMKEIFIDG
jgi:F-type H+-transporting ATPase subunit b